MKSEGEKERIKLRANYLNGLAIALFAVSVVAPVVAAFGARDWLAVLASLVLVWAGGMGSWELHKLAQKTVADLDA